MTTRQQLDGLNRQCEDVCKSRDWMSPMGNPNMLLLYSLPETFEPPSTLMLLGRNPGGTSSDADSHPCRKPFDPDTPCGWSHYLDERWGRQYPPGEHPMQCTVRFLADAIEPGAGDDLLRESPAGNFSPFRPKKDWKGGEIGWQLLDMARPRILILLFSALPLWEQLVNRRKLREAPAEPHWDIGANHRFREAKNPAGDWPQFTFALPAVNNKKSPNTHKEPLAKLPGDWGWAQSSALLVNTIALDRRLDILSGEPAARRR